MSLIENLENVRGWVENLENHPDVETIVQEIGFEFNGTWISNPYYDETLRFQVDPIDYYGEENIKKFVDDVVKQRMSFSLFKENVRNRGGIWATNDVLFTQFKDGYGASYKPNYPERSSMDCALTYNWITNAWSYITPEQYRREYDNVGNKKETLDERIAEADARRTGDVVRDKDEQKHREERE